MPGNRKSVYWDSCAFLSYVNEIPARIRVLETLLEKSSAGEIIIYTSTLSHVEVAFSESERETHVLSTEVEIQISNLWADTNLVTSVELHPAIALIARRLMRDAVAIGQSLKPLDATHLATAQWLSDVGRNVDEFHTYDKGFSKYAAVVSFDIVEPYVQQPRLTSP